MIYNRLARLFHNEHYCNLAINNYKSAFRYVEIINDINFKSNLLKELANTYHLSNNPDSALYYYNESLKTSSDLTNRLDIEKSIAQILYDKGEKDSAYTLIKKNLEEIDVYSSKDSYYAILGDIYYNDKEYDSACHYFNKVVNSLNIYTKLFSATRLSAICDSLGDYEKKIYYNKISVELLEKNINNSVEKGKLQSYRMDITLNDGEQYYGYFRVES